MKSSSLIGKTSSSALILGVACLLGGCDTLNFGSKPSPSATPATAATAATPMGPAPKEEHPAPPVQQISRSEELLPPQEAAAAKQEETAPAPHPVARRGDEVAAQWNRQARTKVFGALELYWEFDPTYDADHPWLRGTVTNRGERVFRYIKVKVDYLRPDGTIRDGDFCFPVARSELAPGQTCEWKMPCRAPQFLLAIEEATE